MLKKSLSLALIFSASILLAQEPQSFRAQALGGIVSDDLDLIYDPIELSFVGGTRLYTNLSNLTSGNEALMNDLADDELLIGVNKPCPLLDKIPGVDNARAAVLLRKRDTEFSNPVWLDTDLDGFDDLFDTGYLRGEYTGYFDNDFDGLYDTRQGISQSRENVDTGEGGDLTLNFSFDLSRWKAGLRIFTHNDEDAATRSPAQLGSGTGALGTVGFNDPQFTRELSTYDIDQEYTTWDLAESGSFSDGMEDSGHGLHLALMEPDFRGFELRGDLLYRRLHTRSDDTGRYEVRYADYHPDLEDYDDSYQEVDAWSFSDDEEGGELILVASCRKTTHEAVERKNEGFFGNRLWLGFGSTDAAGNMRSNFSSTDMYYDGLDTLLADWSDSDLNEWVRSESGTRDLFRAGWSFRLNRPLDDRVYFGIGITLEHVSRKFSGSVNFSQENLRTYELNDEVQDANDFVTSVTQGYRGSLTTEEYTNRLELPVGVELRFTKSRKWVMRFGTRFTSTETVVRTSEQITASDPLVTETVWGDGALALDIQDNEYLSTSSRSVTVTSDTDFFYGLGYNPTESLQVDLLGFFGTLGNQIIDANFYRSLRLSFTLRL